MQRQRPELVATVCWIAAGALLALSMLLVFSFGPLLAPVAVLVLVRVARRHATGRAPLGAGLGFALLPASLAVMHSGYSACPPSPAEVAGGSWSCGGTNPLPFVIVAGLMVVGFLAAWRLSRE